MERCEGEDPDPAEVPPETRLLLAFKTFLSSRKGLLLLAQVVLSFIIFICYIASISISLMMVPLLTFLLALCFFVSYSLKLNEKFRGIYWLLGDFLYGIIAALIFFAISIATFSKSGDIASNVAGAFGLIIIVVYCAHVYFTFNELATFLKQEDSSKAPKSQKSENGSDSDSD